MQRENLGFRNMQLMREWLKESCLQWVDWEKVITRPCRRPSYNLKLCLTKTRWEHSCVLFECKPTCTFLTHLSRMEFPTLINLTSSFSCKWMLGGIFHFYLKVHRIFCKQTVETLIRRRVLRRLIRVCAVCLSPKEKNARLIWVTEYLNKQSKHNVLVIWVKPSTRNPSIPL